MEQLTRYNNVITGLEKDTDTLFMQNYMEIKIHEFLHDRYPELTLYNAAQGQAFILEFLKAFKSDNPDSVKIIARTRNKGIEPIGQLRIDMYADKEEGYLKYTDRSDSILYLTDFEVYIVLYDNMADRSWVQVYAKNDESYLKFREATRAFNGVNRYTKISRIIDGSKGTKTTPIEREDVSRSDVFMVDSIKDHIYDSIDHFFSDNSSFYEEMNIPHKRGIIMYGPPGNGKTTIIKSIISNLKALVITWQVTEYTTSETINEVFDRANGQLDRVLLIIEDIDSIPKGAKSTFLNALDGLSTTKGLFIIATTNHPEVIDSAILNRSGRFDKSYLIGNPTEELRRGYLINKGILKFSTDEDLDILVKGTNDFSMASLNEVYIHAGMQKVKDGKVDASQIIKELKDAFDKQRKGNFTSKNSGGMGFIERG